MVTPPPPSPADDGSLVWIDGALLPRLAATVRHDDHGLVVGDGVFETIATVRRTPFALGRHLDRLRRSAAGLHLEVPVDDDDLRRAVTAVVASHPGDHELRIRVTVTAGPGPLGSARGAGGPTVIVAAAPLGTVAATAVVAVMPWPRNERGALSGLKTTSYAENVLALHEAHRRGADEAIFANTAGELCEGTGSNVFVVLGDEIVTPPLSSGCLAGVTRALVVEAGLAVEAPVPMAAFTGATEAFLTSTARAGQPIAVIDGRRLGPPGEATARVAAYLRTVMDTVPEP